MSVICSLHDKVVPSSQYCNLLTNGHVTTLSQFINLMARLKSWQVDQRSKSLSLDIQTAISVLDSASENIADRDTLEFRKVEFINEQVSK